MSTWDEEDGLIPPRPRVMGGMLVLASFDAMLKERYVRPGDRIKQYVIDERREERWAKETCPRVDVLPHDSDEMHEDEGAERIPCGNRGLVQWHILGGCQTCAAVAYATRKRDDIMAWRRERVARPPICEDRNKLSEEVEPPWPALKLHPAFDMVPRKR